MSNEKTRMKWLAILCIPALASADKSMHWVRAEAIHIASQGGAISRHDEARVEVSFVGTTMVVTDSGTYKEHNLYKTTDDVTTWANTWTGTFKIDADEMQAELTLKDRKCSKTRSHRDPADKTAPCDPIDKAIKLHCIFYETYVETQPGNPPEIEMLWTCHSENNLGQTPLPWVFGGKPACIEAIAGHSGTTYRRCGG